MKKISIIIPCYNCEPTIDRCLQSIVTQDYENTEIILVDDGSTDNTEKIVASYCARFDNICFYKNEHAGVSAARNFGLSVATGDYIQFVDSDDNFLSSTVLSTAASIIENERVDLCVYGFTHPVFEAFLPAGYYDLRDDKVLLRYYQDFFSSMMPWNKLYKREVISEKYVVGMTFGEDEIFNLANLKNIKSVYILDDVFYNYYCADSNTDDKRVSAINQSFEGTDFTKTQNTIWYRGWRNHNHRLDILERDFPAFKEQMLTIRLFDFFFWNLEFIGHLNANDTMLAREVDRIFKEVDFNHAIDYKKNYGLRLKKTMVDDENHLTNFARVALKAYRAMKNSNLGLNVYFVLMNIFAKFFFDYDVNTLDSTDVFANAVMDFELGTSQEAKFTKNILIGA